MNENVDTDGLSLSGAEATRQFAALGVTQTDLSEHFDVSKQRIHAVLERPILGGYWAAMIEQALAHFARLRTDAAEPHLLPGDGLRTAGAAIPSAAPATQSEGSED
jgi:hypothetical protein